MCQVHTGAYVSLLAPEKPTIPLAPREGYHVYTLARGTCHSAYARQTQVNWKKRNKEKKKRREKNVQVRRQLVANSEGSPHPVGISMFLAYRPTRYSFTDQYDDFFNLLVIYINQC